MFEVIYPVNLVSNKNWLLLFLVLKTNVTEK
jgi:hypothetical protein